jgi:hypothetical protein
LYGKKEIGRTKKEQSLKTPLFLPIKDPTIGQQES